MNAQQWLDDEYGDEFLLDTLSQETWLTALHDTLTPELFTHDHTLTGATAARAILTFDHTWHATYTRHPTNDTNTLTLWSPTPDKPFPRSLTELFRNDPHINTWTIHHTNPHDTTTTLHHCITAFGAPTHITLPWASTPLTPTLRDLIDEWENETFTHLQHTLPTLPPTTLRDLTDDADDYTIDPVTLLTWAIFRSQTAPIPTNWTPTPPIHITHGLDLLPPHSPAQKLLTLLHDLEHHNGWIVLRDTCCGTCQTERHDQELHARALHHNTPLIALWADTSHTLLHPDGTINITVPLGDATHVHTLTALAEQHGLHVHHIDTTTITLT